MRDRGELRGVLAAALACLGLLASAASASAAVPSDFWGVVPQSTPTAAQFERLEAGGVDAIRVGIPWAAVQSSEGAKPDWSGVDPLVKGAALAGIEVLPFLSGAPAWAVESVNVGGGVDAPKTLPVKTAAQRDAWSEFLRLAVVRYGPEGSLWSANPRPARAPDPHLADLERGELPLLRRPSQPRPTTAGSCRSPTRRW